MFKLLFFINIFLILTTLIDAKSVKSDITHENTVKEDTSWQNLWFPHPPNYQNNVKPGIVNVATKHDIFSNKSNDSDWTGLWFPMPPNYQSAQIVKETTSKIKDKENKKVCDNGKNDLGIDYDPQDKRHSYKYICLSNRSDYTPNLNESALLMEYLIPAAYEPPVKCMNEVINYSDAIPTFGAYRLLAPKFGTYQFLPPQRWLHSLFDGAIVLLYHPCANLGQREQIIMMLRGCLYRHIITPSPLLTPQRPLALLAWGKILQMSVVDDAIAVKFIKDNARMGFRGMHQNLKNSSILYDAGLSYEAKLVTDEQDNEICGYKEIR